VKEFWSHPGMSSRQCAAWMRGTFARFGFCPTPTYESKLFEYYVEFHTAITQRERRQVILAQCWMLALQNCVTRDVIADNNYVATK